MIYILYKLPHVSVCSKNLRVLIKSCHVAAGFVVFMPCNDTENK